MRVLANEFAEALQAAFALTPLEARLQATREALAPLGLPEERVEEAARPGAFHGVLYPRPGDYPHRFIRYGDAVLAAGKDLSYPEWGEPPVWHPEALWKPLARPSLYWTSRPTPFPPALTRGVEEALTRMTWELGLRSRTTLPVNTVALFPPAWTEGYLIAPLLLLEDREDEIVAPWLLIMEREVAGIFDPYPETRSAAQRYREAWKEVRARYQAFLSGEPLAPLPREALEVFFWGALAE